jgi:NADPH:quinone reductase-like Zn-dependent oxidoreductase
MKAVLFHKFGSSDVLKVEEVSIPTPQENEVLVKVHAIGVNPVDWKMREGYLEGRFPHHFPIIPGWDAAGVIEKAGAGVANFSPGDEVYAYCRKNTVQWGSYAEYICLEENALALKPKTLSFAESAAIPLVTLTAWQALVDFAQLKEEMSVLIHAGAGGVGSMAIQIAKLKGATVYTTTSKKNYSYVKSLGADHSIDYEHTEFYEEIHKYCPNGVDIVLDCVGGQTLEKSIGIIKKQGVLVSIVDFQVERLTKGKEYKSGAIFVAPNSEELRLFADYLDKGVLKPPMIELMPLEKAKEAMDCVKQGHTRGKIVLTT